MKLFECVFLVQEQRKQFRFDGQVELVQKNKEEQTLEFENVEVFEFKDGTYEPFEITTVTWNGCNLDSNDAIGDVISRYSRNEAGFEVLYILDMIREFIDVYRKEFVMVEGREIPYKIVYGSFLDVYELLLITDHYVYYVSDSDEVVMFDTKTSEVISDNYFAGVGYEESLEAIENDTEKQLYKEDE